MDASILISSRTVGGVTFTTNQTNGTITVNGTATEDISQTIMTPLTRLNTNWIPTAYFYLKGCPSGGSLTTYYLCNTWTNSRDYGQGVISRIERAYPTTIYVDMNLFIKQGTVCNNLVFKPQLINLADTYGAGNEPKTPAQFNKDFPDIDNIPYQEQTISFAEQTLYGINTAQDTLQVVKENDGYKLDLIHNITSIDMGTLPYENWSGATGGWIVYGSGNPFKIDVPEINTPALLSQNFASMPRTQFNPLHYNKTMCISTGNHLYFINKNATTRQEFQTEVNGQILYGAARTPTTTTLATLTKTQVTALFAKGYCVEILGNDDNKIIVRPDLTINYSGEVEEIITQSDDTGSEVVE